MKKRCLLIIFFLSLFWLIPSYANAQADVHLSVFKEAKKKISIAVPDFLVTEIFESGDASAVEGADILKNDLNLSGMFDIINLVQKYQRKKCLICGHLMVLDLYITTIELSMKTKT